MFKNLSATILFMAMAFVIVAEQPAFEYCLCDNSLHVAGEDCCSRMAKQEQCGQNCAEKNSEGIITDSEDQCGDCKIPITIDVVDYCWFTPTDMPDLDQTILVELTHPAIVPLYGDPQTPMDRFPPPDQLPESIPLFLGNLSLRL